MKLPACSPCGLAVDWSRRCYSSRWHLFADDKSVSTAGRYYRPPANTPFVGGWHWYGSREWYDKNIGHVQDLGESLTATHKWFSGVAPAVAPPARQIGSSACIENGDKIAAAVTTDDVFDGFISACFLPSQIPLLEWSKVSNFNACEIQFFYATVLKWSYLLDSFSITRAFQMLIPGCAVTWKRGTALYPNLVCVTKPGWAVIVSDGTQTYQQWAVQGMYGLLPPTNIGLYGTLLLWYQASQRALDLMEDCGVMPADKVMLCGHSYGAANVYNVAARLRANDPARSIRHLCFGSPKPGDRRLSDLIERTQGLSLANDQDIVCSIPPDFAAVFALLTVVLLPGMMFWPAWERPPFQTGQHDDGSLTPHEYPILDGPTLLRMCNQILAGAPFDAVLTHTITVYRRFILLRCPEPDCLISQSLWDWLNKPDPELATGAIGIGGNVARGSLPLDRAAASATPLSLAAMPIAEGSIEIVGDIPAPPTPIASGSILLGGAGIDDGAVLLGGDVTASEPGVLLGGDVTASEPGVLLGGDVTASEPGVLLGGDVPAPPPAPASGSMIFFGDVSQPDAAFVLGGDVPVPPTPGGPGAITLNGDGQGEPISEFGTDDCLDSPDLDFGVWYSTLIVPGQSKYFAHAPAPVPPAVYRVTVLKITGTGYQLTFLDGRCGDAFSSIATDGVLVQGLLGPAWDGTIGINIGDLTAAGNATITWRVDIV